MDCRAETCLQVRSHPLRIHAVGADELVIGHQDRNSRAVPAFQLRLAFDIDNLHRRGGTEQLRQVFEHALAQAAVGPAVNRPDRHEESYWRCSRAIGASAASSLVTASAIASTVAAGTSPTAVTW